MSHELRCPEHPKYTGQNHIKRLEKCDGCKAVRIAYKERIEKKRNQGKGPYPSMTSPNFNCGMIHLFAEMTVLMVYGHQPAFFWRKGSNSSVDAKKLYQDSYNTIVGFLERNENAKKGIPRFLYQTCMAMRAKVLRDQMAKDHKIKQSSREEFAWIEDDQPLKECEPLVKPDRNMFLED